MLVQLFGLAVAPYVALSRHERREREELRADLVRNHRLLESRTSELARLRDRAESNRILLAKLFEMYGQPAETKGIGGIPLQHPMVEPGLEAPERALREAEHGIAVATKFLEELVAYEREHRNVVAVTPSVSPLDCAEFVLTAPFGRRTSPFTKAAEFHNGLDLSIPEGTPVLAPANATVVFAGRFQLSASVNWWRYGNCVVLSHDGYFETIFAHLSETSVRSGARVRQGDVIGRVGNTGWSTAPHLHYEVRVPNAQAKGGFLPVDPRIYMLDCRWNDEKNLLAARRQAPSADEFDPLPVPVSH